MYQPQVIILLYLSRIGVRLITVRSNDQWSKGKIRKSTKNNKRYLAICGCVGFKSQICTAPISVLALGFPRAGLICYAQFSVTTTNATEFPGLDRNRGLRAI